MVAEVNGAELRHQATMLKPGERSLIAQWLRVSQGHEMFCHDPDVIGPNPSMAKL